MKAYWINETFIMIGGKVFPRSGIFLPEKGYLAIRKEDNKIFIGDFYDDKKLIDSLKNGIEGEAAGEGNLYDLRSKVEEFDISKESLDLLINSTESIKLSKKTIESAVKQFLK